MSSSVVRRIFFWLVALVIAQGLVACGPVINADEPIPTITVKPGFQTMLSPLPTIPPYRCGAWSSNNAPGTNATIAIYARLTHNMQGVAGIQASATVHFQSGDFTIPQTLASDAGGYVSFTLNLQGRQPARVPATVDVTFNGLPKGAPLLCTAFFTPG